MTPVTNYVLGREEWGVKPAGSKKPDLCYGEVRKSTQRSAEMGAVHQQYGFCKPLSEKGTTASKLCKHPCGTRMTLTKSGFFSTSETRISQRRAVKVKQWEILGWKHWDYCLGDRSSGRSYPQIQIPEGMEAEPALPWGTTEMWWSNGNRLKPWDSL